MAMTRAELSKRLRDVERELPHLCSKYPNKAAPDTEPAASPAAASGQQSDAEIEEVEWVNPDFWNAFASCTEFASEDAGAQDIEWVNAQLDSILRKHYIRVPDDGWPIDG